MQWRIALHDQVAQVRADGAREQTAAAFVVYALNQVPLQTEISPSRPRDILAAAAQEPPPTSDLLCAERYMRELTQDLIWHYRSGLALHAAMLEVDQRIFLLPAISGSGKSTLTAHLAINGLAGKRVTVHTDELVFVAPSERSTSHCRLYPLRRPLHLRPNSYFLLDAWPQKHNQAVWTDESKHVLLGHAAFDLNVKQLSHMIEAEPTVVFPKYVAESPEVTTQLSQAQTVFYLLSTLLNARNLTGAGASHPCMSALAQRGFKTTYGTLPDAPVWAK